jgi:hypothetical protein
MWDEPDPGKGSHLWITVPMSDGKPLAYATHGIAARHARFAQERGSLLMVTHDLPGAKFPYALGFIPGGWRAMIDESRSTGRIFLHYGSVLIALHANHPFAWDPHAGVLSGARREADSEFRVEGPDVALALETALPPSNPEADPRASLESFRMKVMERSRLSANSFLDREGTLIEREFDGDTRINGRRTDYESWPLLENPWMRQEWEGNLTISDGRTRRVYDVENWTVTETPLP